MEAGNFIQRNWQNLIWVAGLLFAAGGAYSEFKLLHRDIEELEHKIEEIRKQSFEELEQRTDDLEEWKAYKEGQDNRT